MSYEMDDIDLDLFYLGLFFQNSIKSIDYIPSEEFANMISVTSYGEKYSNILKDYLKDLKEFEINFTFLTHFGYDDPFINASNTDIEGIKNILNGEILDSTIRFPWVFDRFLYDKFFSFYDEEPPEALSNEESIKFLADTPIGVFQLGKNLIGPYGLLKSSYNRILRPTMEMPLWHCPNPACNKIHYVTLLNKNNRMNLISSILTKKIKENTDPHLAKKKLLNKVYYDEPEFFDDLLLRDLPAFLMGSFNLEESKQILKRLIDDNSKRMRALFPNNECIKNQFNTDSLSIVRDLDKSQCLQLMLLLENDCIVSTVESLIDENIIFIPATEIRSPKIYKLSSGGWRKTNIQCSRFGIRNSGEYRSLGLERLRRLIREIYENSNELAQLDWKLRRIDGESVLEKLDKFVHSENPEKIISDLVLDNPVHLDYAIKLLRYGNFCKPKSIDEEKTIIKKILWKLGFDVRLYPESLGLFWSRFDKFLSSAKMNFTYNEKDREIIRSSAVNFFVSLEYILNQSLSFIAWALLSDHYQDTKYKLNLSYAQEFMASKLTGFPLGDTKIEFDPTGKNTLFPLIAGFDILANICANINDFRDSYRRQESEIQSYYKFSKLETFPFLHKILFLDLRNSDQNKIIGLLKETTQSLTRAQVCNVRNRIEHARDENEFPKREEIEFACNAIQKIIRDLIYYGVCPSIYYFSGTVSDRYKRTTIKYTNYENEETLLLSSDQFYSCCLPRFEKPVVIVPCMRIGDSAEIMRFEFEESSNYTKIWENYPKRRKEKNSDNESGTQADANACNI